jgi:cytochrome P450
MPPIIKGHTPDGREAWIVKGHGQVTELLADPRVRIQPPTSESGSWFDDSPMHRIMLRLAGRAVPDGQSDREERTRRRNTMTKMFRRTSVHRAMPDVKGFADTLIDEMIADGAPADLTDRYSVPLCAKVVCDLLAVPDSDIPLFRRWAGDKNSHDFRTAAIALRQLTVYVRKLVEQRLAEPGDDIVSFLLHHGDDDGDTMHVDRTSNLVVWMLGLGWQASAAAIDYGMILLDTHRDQRALLMAEPDLLPRAVEEILRHHDPAPREVGGADRYAELDFEYDGVQIRKDEMLVLDLFAANHDPEIFARPDEFDITRDPNPHITFGYGFYYCNFNQVARAEIQAALEVLLRRLPDVRLAKRPEELEYMHFPTTGPVSLPVAW